LAVLIAALLVGCAADRAHRAGLHHLDEGRWEEGLARLEEAVEKDPDNARFRLDLRVKREQHIHRALLDADARRASGQLDVAEKLYERILKIEKDNARARAGLSVVAMERRHAEVFQEAQALAKNDEIESAQAKLHTILTENPHHAEAKALQRRIAEKLVADTLTAPTLKTRGRRPVTLEFRDANVKMVLEALSRTSDINFLIDKDVRPDFATTIFVKHVTVDDAIDLILSQNQLTKKVLNENTVFVYPNTPAKTKEYQDQIIKAFYLTNVDPKHAMEMLKVMLNAKTLFVDEKTNLVIMRDIPETVRMAEKLIAAMDLPEPEVMMEVEVLEIKRSRLLELGIDYPAQLSLSTGTGTTPAPLTVQGLRDTRFKDLFVNHLSATVNLKKQDSDVSVLASPRIRARNKEKAKILIGDRVPVITSSSMLVGTASQQTTNVQYLDVGLKLEVEPAIHLDNDVAIKVNLEVSSIVKEIKDVANTIAYQIGTRNATTLLRLKDGETQILAGLINDDERKSANKIPGLGDLPILGRLFSSHKDDSNKTEIILSITPRLIRSLNRPEAQIAEFWYGTETSVRSKPLSIEPVGASIPQPAAIESAVPPPAPDATPLPPPAPGSPPAASPGQAASPTPSGGPTPAAEGTETTTPGASEITPPAGPAGQTVPNAPETPQPPAAPLGSFSRGEHTAQSRSTPRAYAVAFLRQPIAPSCLRAALP
jgi:general secretion pathway protein D